MVEDRIAALEARADTLENRLRQLEEPTRSCAQLPATDRAAPAARRPAAPRPVAPPKPARDIEDYLGGNVLAWVGGFAVLAGLAFLLTIAISRGWLGEGARTLLAGGLSLDAARRRRVAARAPRPHRGRRGRGRGRHRRPVRDARGRRAGLRPSPPPGRAARRDGDRRRRRRRWRSAGARRCSAGSASSARSARRSRSAPSTAAGSCSWRSPSRPRSPCSSGSAGPRSPSPRSPSRRCSGSDGCVIDGLGDPATIATLTVFGALSAALALGFELNRPGLHRVAIGPRARVRPHPFAIVLVVSAALLAITGWELLDGEPWLVALAAAHIAAGIAAAHVRRISREVVGRRPGHRHRARRSRVRLDGQRAAAGARLGAVGAPVRRAARRPHRRSEPRLRPHSRPARG